MKALIQAALLTLCATGAYGAANWVSLAKTPEGEMLLDVSSVSPRGNYAKAWERIDHYSIRKSPTGFEYRSQLALVLYDCKERQSGPQELIYYSEIGGRGQAETQFALEVGRVRLEDVAPGTVGERMLDSTCGILQSKSKK